MNAPHRLDAPLSPGGWVSPDNPRLKLYSTLVICAGCLLTYLTLPDGPEVQMYRYCAYTMVTTIAIAFGIEALGGVRSLIRVDIVAIGTFYFLTFAEFLSSNTRVLYQQETGGGALACLIVLSGTACIAIGRQFPFPTRLNPREVRLPEVSPRGLLMCFFFFAFLGYFYVLLVTEFNLFEIVRWVLKPRFMRPWQRGAEGDWRSFLTELKLLLYICAALAGYFFANPAQFGVRARIAVAIILAWMTFFDFAEGARNVVLIKVGLWLVTYFIANRRAHNLKIIFLSVAGLSLLWVASGYMLAARNQGLGSYVSEGERAQGQDQFMIDNNMITIARVVVVFPRDYPYPGMEIVTQSFTKWVPRALWPGKPIGLTTSIESALDTGGGFTLAVTYAGEAYLIAGLPTVILVSLLLGSAAATWTRVGLSARTNLDLIYYASGFFAATLGMRSTLFITVAIVPSAALYFFGRYVMRRSRTPRWAT
jgi:hypothetical protein